MATLDEMRTEAIREELKFRLDWFEDLTPEEQEKLVDQFRTSFWGSVKAVGVLVENMFRLSEVLNKTTPTMTELEEWWRERFK